MNEYSLAKAQSDNPTRCPSRGFSLSDSRWELRTHRLAVDKHKAAKLLI